MQVFCAWCCRDGRVGYLGEREPLENPEPTHGVCEHHKAQLLESLPSRSFPDARLLIVVRRNDTALYARLQQSFADVSGAWVIVDRRISDRRSASSRESDERRYLRTRRIRHAQISSLGFAVVRFTPKSRLDPDRVGQRGGASASQPASTSPGPSPIPG